MELEPYPLLFYDVILKVTVDAVERKVWVQAGSALGSNQCAFHRTYAPTVYEKVRVLNETLPADIRQDFRISFVDSAEPYVVISVIRRPRREFPVAELMLDAARNPALLAAAE